MNSKEREYQEIIDRLERKASESKQQSLVLMCDFFNRFKDDLKEISLLQGKLREIRLKDLKKSLIESLAKTSLITFNVDSDYRNIFYDEIMSIYEFE